VDAQASSPLADEAALLQSVKDALDRVVVLRNAIQEAATAEAKFYWFMSNSFDPSCCTRLVGPPVVGRSQIISSQWSSCEWIGCMSRADPAFQAVSVIRSECFSVHYFTWNKYKLLQYVYRGRRVIEWHHVCTYKLRANAWSRVDHV
jgi:hypothetical protein